MGNRWQGLLHWMFFGFCLTSYPSFWRYIRIGRGSLILSWIKIDEIVYWKIWYLRASGSSRRHENNNWRGQWDFVRIESWVVEALTRCGTRNSGRCYYEARTWTPYIQECRSSTCILIWMLHCTYPMKRSQINQQKHSLLYLLVMIGDVLLRIVQWVRGEVLAQEGEERGEGARTKEDSVHSLQGRSSTLLYYAMF